MAEVGDVSGEGAAERIAEGEAGLEGFAEAERGDAPDAGRDEGGFAGEVAEDEGFAPNEKASACVSDEEVALGEVFFDNGGQAGGFHEVDAGIEGAAPVEESADGGGCRGGIQSGRNVGRQSIHRWKKLRRGGRESSANGEMGTGKR